MQIVLHWPYSANVHCEIDVDDDVATQLDQFVAPTMDNTDPMNGVLQCGSPLPGTTAKAASRSCRPTPTPAGRRRETTAPWRRRSGRCRRRRGYRLCA